MLVQDGHSRVDRKLEEQHEAPEGSEGGHGVEVDIVLLVVAVDWVNVVNEHHVAYGCANGDKGSMVKRKVAGSVPMTQSILRHTLPQIRLDPNDKMMQLSHDGEDGTEHVEGNL